MSDPQDDLKFTQDLRRVLVRDYLGKDPAAVAGDPEKLAQLSTLMNDMDRASLGIMRIKVDEKGGNAAAAVLAALPALFSRPDLKTLGNEGSRTATPVLEDGLVEFEIVPGEMEAGISTEDHAAFLARMRGGEKNKASQ